MIRLLHGAGVCLVFLLATANCRADAVADFVAHYASVDKKVGAFRAKLSAILFMPKGAHSADSDIPASIPRPIPAKDLFLPFKSEMEFTKSPRRIRKVDETDLFFPKLGRSELHRRLHHYDGQQYQLEVSGLGHAYSVQHGNTNTSIILHNFELPAFWAAGLQWYGMPELHSEIASPKWEVASLSTPGRVGFKKFGSPVSFSLFHTSGPPNWDIEVYEFIAKGVPSIRWEFEPWRELPSGIRVPTKWRLISVDEGRSSGQVDVSLDEYEVNIPFDAALFTANSGKTDLRRFIVSNEVMVEIPNTDTNGLVWYLLALLVILLFAAAYLLRRFLARVVSH